MMSSIYSWTNVIPLTAPNPGPGNKGLGMNDEPRHRSFLPLKSTRTATKKVWWIRPTCSYDISKLFLLFLLIPPYSLQFLQNFAWTSHIGLFTIVPNTYNYSADFVQLLVCCDITQFF